jgi:molybdopterin converting factor small subunit
MASLTVRYHNVLRSAAGVAEEMLPVPEVATLYALLEALSAQHGPSLRNLLLEADGSVVSHLVVFVNRKLILGDPRGVPLNGDDEVMLFPAVSGG